MDTCKVANLFTCYPEADLLEFVNAPIGKGSPVTRSLRPLIAVPTTAGTGSETTGTAIFDHGATGAKTGIANRALRPTLGIIDPLNTADCPLEVHISAGLDVLFHSLESYTALPFEERTPRPAHPQLRPAYQGRNPVSDVFSFWALEQTVKYLPLVKQDPYDLEARTQLCLAASFAGIGFGNAGVTLCHAASYPISGLNKSYGQYKHKGYQVDHPIVPHGISVALTGPAVFEFLAPSSPDRHRTIAQVFHQYGSAHDLDPTRVSDPATLGQMCYDRIAAFLAHLEVPRGLTKIGYGQADIPTIVQGILPQRRVLDLAPGVAEMPVEQSTEALSHILERSLEY